METVRREVMTGPSGTVIICATTLSIGVHTVRMLATLPGHNRAYRSSFKLGGVHQLMHRSGNNSSTGLRKQRNS
eukprot:907115-Pyramimonas_sp.AAC.1